MKVSKYSTNEYGQMKHPIVDAVETQFRQILCEKLVRDHIIKDQKGRIIVSVSFDAAGTSVSKKVTLARAEWQMSLDLRNSAIITFPVTRAHLYFKLTIDKWSNLEVHMAHVSRGERIEESAELSLHVLSAEAVSAAHVSLISPDTCATKLRGERVTSLDQLALRCIEAGAQLYPKIKERIEVKNKEFLEKIQKEMSDDANTIITKKLVFKMLHEAATEEQGE